MEYFITSTPTLIGADRFSEHYGQLVEEHRSVRGEEQIADYTFRTEKIQVILGVIVTKNDDK